MREIEAKSLLRKQKRIDSWFVSRYGMNLYRGCVHNCVYCDGRAEKYQVEGEFGKEVAVKINAPDILRRELDPARKRKPMKPGYILLCGGVGDGYQPVEQTCRLTRQILDIVAQTPHPVHTLTKSIHVLDDLARLKAINAKTRAVVSFSFSTVDETVARRFEPGVPKPWQRLEAIQKLKAAGLACGMFLMPVIPFISDSEEQIDASVAAAKSAGVDFIIFGGLTLKEGRQKRHFMRVLRESYPPLVEKYEALYPGNAWGQTSQEYYAMLMKRFYAMARKHGMPVRLPFYLFDPYLDLNDRVTVLLDHIDYALKCRGEKSPYGYAAHSVAMLKEPVTARSDLTVLKGVGPVTERIIREIIKTGSCSLYRKLL